MVDTGDRAEDGAEAEEVAMWAVRTLHWLVDRDNVGAYLLEMVVCQSPTLDHARRDVRDEDVGPFDQAQRQPLALVRVQVEGDVELVGVVVVVPAADVVAGLAGGKGGDAAKTPS